MYLPLQEVVTEDDQIKTISALYRMQQRGRLKRPTNEKDQRWSNNIAFIDIEQWTFGRKKSNKKTK